MSDDSLSRRDFLKGATLTTMGLLLAGREIMAQGENEIEPVGPAVTCAVIGTGVRGRDLLSVLSRLPNADVKAICDTYDIFLRRAQQIAPGSEQIEDYRRVLDNKEIEAVFVSTPSHLHKDIVLAAVAAGKHVYCEAPLAASLSDAREMALAGKGSERVFRIGQQQRSSELHRHVLGFVRTGVIGRVAGGRAQWHKRQSWRRLAPVREREKELNWRLYRESSPGLIGEEGIHQLDILSWYLGGPPVSVSGSSAITCWDDGREVPDTVHCVFEFPRNVRVFYSATLANSFEGASQVIYGSESAILMREDRAWLFKEADSPLLGWEVYAHKEQFGDETGICLLADATHLEDVGEDSAKESEEDAGKDATYHSLGNFLMQIRGVDAPGCSAVEGYRAAVVALKANEAALSGTTLTYEKEWFELG